MLRLAYRLQTRPAQPPESRSFSRTSPSDKAEPILVPDCYNSFTSRKKAEQRQGCASAARRVSCDEAASPDRGSVRRQHQVLLQRPIRHRVRRDRQPLVLFGNSTRKTRNVIPPRSSSITASRSTAYPAAQDSTGNPDRLCAEIRVAPRREQASVDLPLLEVLEQLRACASATLAPCVVAPQQRSIPRAITPAARAHPDWSAPRSPAFPSGTHNSPT